MMSRSVSIRAMVPSKHSRSARSLVLSSCRMPFGSSTGTRTTLSITGTSADFAAAVTTGQITPVVRRPERRNAVS